jgi:hypothetical protein
MHSHAGFARHRIKTQWDIRSQTGARSLGFRLGSLGWGMLFISSVAQTPRQLDGRTSRLKPSGSSSASKADNLIRALSRQLKTNLSDLSHRSDHLIPQEEEPIANVGDSEMARSLIKYFRSRDLALPGDLPRVVCI